MSPRAVRLFTLALFAVTIPAAIAAMLVGSVHIAPGEVARRCWSAAFGHAGPDAIDRVLLEIRLPRIVCALAIGAGQALAGLAAQTLFRNPLASAQVVGVSSGAALGAVLATLWLGAGPLVTPLLSLIVGLGVTAAVFALARRGTLFGHTLLLAGLAIGTFCSALTAALLYMAGERLQSLVFWLMGGLWRTDWNAATAMSTVTVLAAAVLWMLAPAMNVMLAGERTARDLGVNVDRLQGSLVATIAVTVAMAVSLTGLIGFICLIVPHLCRTVVGAEHRRLLPVTALAGALLLLLADTAARTLAAPAEIPVGILTALVGAPVFLWFLLGRKSGVHSE